MKNGPRTFLGPPRPEPANFFFAPGGLQEPSGDEFLSVLAAPWGPLGPQVVPGGLPEASRRSFRSFSEQFWLHFCIVLGYFCSCSRSRLGTSAIVFLIRSVSCSYSFSLACSCSLFVFGRLRSLLRRPTGLAVLRSRIAPRSGASSFTKRSFKQQACLLLEKLQLLPPAPESGPSNPGPSIFAPLLH